jgi:hypothetical protein
MDGKYYRGGDSKIDMLKDQSDSWNGFYHNLENEIERIFQSRGSLNTSCNPNTAL